MADNVSIKDFGGNAAVIATDQVTDATLGTVEVQYMKLMDGTIDSTNKLVIDSSGRLQANIGNLPTDLAVSGTITALSQTISIPTSETQTVGVQISGTWSGSLTPEVSIDGTTYYPINFVDTGGGLLGNTWSANNLGQINVGGTLYFRVRASAWSSGTATISLRATSRSSVISLNESLPQGSNTIGAVSQSGTWNIGSITTMPTTPVTGTFWQTTQPVSGTVGITGTVATAEVPPTTVAHALATVTTAGTSVQLPANTAKSITVKASTTNTGIIYVGGSTVSASNGFPLYAGDTVSLDISNTSVIWIDASINAQTANWISNE